MEEGKWKKEDGRCYRFQDKVIDDKCWCLFCEDSLEVKGIMCKFVACFLKD